VTALIRDRSAANRWSAHIFEAVLFVAIGAFIMVVFNPWGAGPRLSPGADYLAKIGAGLLLLGAALQARRSARFEKYWPMLFAFFVLTVAVSLDFVFAKYLIKHLGLTDTTPAGWALPKLNECFVIVSVILIFTWLSGGDLGSIYLQRGNLKLGLTVGLIFFFIFAAGGIPMAELFRSRNLRLARIIPWIPWVLIFVLANGTMEELLFRGLFLRKLQPFFGKFIANFLVAVVFSGIHLGSVYTADERIFIAVLFPQALALGYIMQKTEGVWGSILFHAGMDIPVILGIFSNL
jgi:membrane protease YdiL (CAAX protease family)